MNLNSAVDTGSTARVQAMMSSSSTADAAGNGAPLKRPGGGMKWSEVCERVQQPDGSVRTSPRIKSGIAATVSPPRPRPSSHGLDQSSAVRARKLGKHSSGGSLPTTGSSGGAPSSRGGSSRGGSSGKSSRSSSLDGSHKARDGDISSRCSSGCWDSVSSEHSRPRTPPGIAPSPSGGLNSLLMPDPIRTGLMLPPSLLDDETVHVSENKLEENCVDSLEANCVDEVAQDSVQISPCFESQVMAEPRPGPISFKWDPYGRDMPRRIIADGNVKGEWSVEPLAKYLKRVVMQIDANIETHRLPTAEKLDAFVSRLVANTHRLLKHAPKKVRQTLQSMLSRRFQRFWNFARNEKVRSTNPEELKSMLTCLVDALICEFGLSPDAVEECFLVMQQGQPVPSFQQVPSFLGQYSMSPDRQEPQLGLHLVPKRHHRSSLAVDPFGRG